MLGDRKRVVQVDCKATVRDAAKAMAEENVGSTAVMDGRRLVGLFTERDLLKRVLLRDLDVDQVLVEQVMTHEIVTVHADEDVRMARLRMRDHHIRHLPVVGEEGEMMGMLSIRDLIVDEMEEVKRYLRIEET